MTEIKLFRREPAKYAGHLETRTTDLSDMNQFLIQEFGPDSNWGINSALAYVSQKYGGGRYEVKFRMDGKYVRCQVFEIAGLPNLKCRCDLKKLMTRGCQCKGI